MITVTGVDSGPHIKQQNTASMYCIYKFTMYARVSNILGNPYSHTHCLNFNTIYV